jgi:hypothetical protein
MLHLHHLLNLALVREPRDPYDSLTGLTWLRRVLIRGVHDPMAVMSRDVVPPSSGCERCRETPAGYVVKSDTSVK